MLGKKEAEVCMLDGVEKKCKVKEDVKVVWKPKGVENKVDRPVIEGMLEYVSRPDDLVWANGGMVATVTSGDSTLSLQQRVEDAGFVNVVVTPMGSDRVFIHCLNGEDIWKVFNDAIHFLGMLFKDLHKWSSEDVNYERGAWLYIYGTPVHVWNELFFNLCVSGCGRYIRSDECTVNRVRLDYARVLIYTSHLEVVNSSAEVVIDGIKHVLKLVEEWGCNLGEDSFLSEEETVPPTEALSNINDVADTEDIQGDMDDLVEDLNEAWLKGTEAHVGNLIDDDCIPLNKTKDKMEILSTQAEAVVGPHGSFSGDKGKLIEDVSKQIVGSCSITEGNKRALKSIPSSKNKKKKTVGVSFKHSAGFVKRIARLPLSNRKEILKVLKKQESKRRVLSKATKVMATSNSSNTSNSSVNKDWEHWAVLHDKNEKVAEDVREIGKTLGVNFDGGKKSGLNLLTREGRKELRAGRGSLLIEGDVEDGVSVKEGV